MLEKFEAYHKRAVELHKKREKIEQLSALFTSARKKIALLDTQTKDATICVDSGWVGYNEVHYIFCANNQSLLCFPKPGEPSKVVFRDGNIALVL